VLQADYSSSAQCLCGCRHWTNLCLWYSLLYWRCLVSSPG